MHCTVNDFGFSVPMNPLLTRLAWARAEARGSRMYAYLIIAIAVLSLSVGPPNALASNRTGWVYHPDYLLHDTGPGHPEQPERLEAILAHLKSEQILSKLTPIHPVEVDDAWLRAVHKPEYLALLASTAKPEPTRLDADTTASQHSYRVARLATGGVIAAVEAVMEDRIDNAFVASRPPGHHALADRAMGFCLLNHVAIAARYLQSVHGLERILIIDWDVHHGNATQSIFYDDPRVLYFSTHQSPWYPGTGHSDETGAGDGKGFNLNVPLPAGAGDEAIVAAFKQRLVPAADAYRPQFVLISAGFDAHRADPLANLQVTEVGFSQMTRIVKSIAERHAGGRIVSVLEGGYALSAMSKSVAAHVRVLMDTAP